MADCYNADANLGQVRIESILRRNLIYLKSRELKGFLRNLINTAVSTLSFDVDI